MSGCCGSCGSTTGRLHKCSRCKTVAYCGKACQREDWDAHKQICKRKDFNGAPCDLCSNTENGIIDACLNCGFLFCSVCEKQQNYVYTRNGAGDQMIRGIAPCQGCHHARCSTWRPNNNVKFNKLIKNGKRDPRKIQWITLLGSFYLQMYKQGLWPTGKQKAKEQFLRAGNLGFGEAYSRLAELYLEDRNWDEAKRYFQKAADRLQVISICMLGFEALNGYFGMSKGQSRQRIVQEDQRHPPDYKKAFRLFRQGAALGHAPCCMFLGRCYLHGQGTDIDHTKAFKWYHTSAEKGDVDGMRACAECYRLGKGVEQSHAHAKYWYEKSLEVEDNDDARASSELYNNT